MPGKPGHSSFSTLIPQPWLVALGTHSGKHVSGVYGTRSQVLGVRVRGREEASSRGMMLRGGESFLGNLPGALFPSS